RTAATPLDITAGMTLPGLEFRTYKQELYSVRIRLMAPGDKALPWSKPWDHVSVTIDDGAQDRLAYHESHDVDEQLSWIFGLVPPGTYSIGCYIHRSFPEEEDN